MCEELPIEVQGYAKVLDNYKKSDSLEQFDIFHMYPGNICFPDGYYDSRFFKLVGFNTKTMEKRDLGDHDSIDIELGVQVVMLRVFLDGSTLIKFDSLIETVGITQAVSVTRAGWKERLENTL